MTDFNAVNFKMTHREYAMSMYLKVKCNIFLKRPKMDFNKKFLKQTNFNFLT